MINNEYISMAIGILGVFLAIFFYLKSVKKKQITYSSKSFNLINDSTSSIAGFTACYQGKPLARLKASKILVWNSGNEIVLGEDFASTSPLKMEFSNDSKVLEAKLSGYSKKANDVRVSLDPAKRNQVDLSFEYLGKGEGFIVALLHTSTMDAPEIEAVIKGFGSPVKYGNEPSGIILKNTLNAIVFFFIVTLLGTMYADVKELPGSINEILDAAIPIFALLYLMGHFIESLLRKRSLPKLHSEFDSAFVSKDFS